MPVPAIANGPIALTDTTTGKHISIPLTALVFDAGKLNASAWPGYNTYKAQLDPWLDHLADIKVVVPGEVESPKPAMVIKAVAEGLPGNDVRVQFSNIVVDPADPSQRTFDARITEMQEYKGLDPATLNTVLGTEAVRGTRPGLVTIPAADVPALPKNGDYQLAAGGAAVKAKKDVAKQAAGPGKAFTVEARRAGVKGNKIKVTIADVDADLNTFTLRAEYVETLLGLKTGNLPVGLAGAANSEFMIQASPPPGGAFGVPSPGVVSLTGGREQQAATPASATIFTA
jgi:hypothetical protein